MPDFSEAIGCHIPDGLTCGRIRHIQVNIGRRCNLACRHCHLECAPERGEQMDAAVMDAVVNIVSGSTAELVDITGGSPELHPDFRYFVGALRSTGIPVQVRTNLAALLEPGLEGTMEFLRKHDVRLVGSMPCYQEENVRAQRGPGVYEKSIRALTHLNALGYGGENGLQLNLVYNPGGAFLPAGQAALEKDYKQKLKDQFGIRFTRLLVITNMPIGRFGRLLAAEGAMDRYMAELARSFNPDTLEGLMCRHQIGIDYDGRIYDCDFNIALHLPVNHGAPDHIREFDRRKLEGRHVVVGNHCFGCTAGAGSSCGGALAH